MCLKEGKNEWMKRIKRTISSESNEEKKKHFRLKNKTKKETKKKNGMKEMWIMLVSWGGITKMCVV